MLEDKEEYLKNQKKFFEDTHHLMTENNHHAHNPDPEYWNILLGDIKSEPKKWEGKKALDFGCGCGRNLKNLVSLCEWETVDGCDISVKNASYSKSWFEDNKGDSKAKCITWENSGSDIKPAKNDYYDFIMSHIVFQHISNHSVRYSIIKDMYRSLKKGGLVSLHFMDMTMSSSYYDNSLEFKNCRVENNEFLVKDLEEIGFNAVTCETGKDFLTGHKSYYVKGIK